MFVMEKERFMVLQEGTHDTDGDADIQSLRSTESNVVDGEILPWYYSLDTIVHMIDDDILCDGALQIVCKLLYSRSTKRVKKLLFHANSVDPKATPTMPTAYDTAMRTLLSCKTSTKWKRWIAASTELTLDVSKVITLPQGWKSFLYTHQATKSWRFSDDGMYALYIGTAKPLLRFGLSTDIDDRPCSLFSEYFWSKEGILFVCVLFFSPNISDDYHWEEYQRNAKRLHHYVKLDRPIFESLRHQYLLLMKYGVKKSV